MDEKVQFLANTSLFSGLSPQAIEAIARDVLTRRYQRGDIIFHEGDVGHVVYFVVEGQVRIFVMSLMGTETSVLYLVEPGAMFGEMAVVDGLPRSATALVVAPTLLYGLSRDAFRRHMIDNPQLALNIMMVLTHRVRRTTRQVDNLATLDVPQRLARKLLELSQRCGIPEDQGTRIGIHLTQTDLASLVGATRESINKALREFRDAGWVRSSRGNIILIDSVSLERIGYQP